MTFSLLTIAMWIITAVLLGYVIKVLIVTPSISGFDGLCLIGMGIGLAIMVAGTVLESRGL